MRFSLQKADPRSILEGREILVALAFTGVWLAVFLGYGAGFFGLLGGLSEPRDAVFLEVSLYLAVLVMPPALVWVAVALLRRSFAVQDEARRLEEQARSGARRATEPVAQPRVKDNRIEGVQEQMRALKARVEQLEAALVELAQAQHQPEPAAQEPEQTPLGQTAFAFGEGNVPSNTTGLDWADLLKALDFPRDANDADGFRALRAAKRDPQASQMLRAAEDVMNLLAKESIYMDDFRPAHASAREWREFAGGTRGAAVAAVGGIEDVEALDRIAARKAQDQIFRDVCLHFLRRYDTMLRGFAAGASDAQMLQLADTRTGRAFMLLARAAHMFD